MTLLINAVLAIGGSLVASILAKATGVAAIALVAAWLARRSRAAVRHVLLAAAFAVLLVLPIASFLAPPLRVEVPVVATQGTAVSQWAATIETVLLIDPVESAAVVPSAAPSASRLSASSVLLAAWVMGALVCWLPIAVGLRQMRSLRRAGLPWRHGQSFVDVLAREVDITRRVEVLLHESMSGPMTCGVIRPAIVLPIDAPAWPEDDLRCAIVHELEHVRRGDWASQCFARIACAGYWFHPLVWIAWRRLSLEAERACDDAVLRRAEATDYADQLVVLAERLSIAPNPPLLAMANRHDLATRVVAVLDSGQRRGRAGARWVALAGAVAGLIVTTMSPLRIVAATVDTPASAATPARQSLTVSKFDVASIKPCKTADVMPQTRSGGRGGGPQSYSTSPGRLNIPCMSVEELIRLAYIGFGASPSERLLNHAGNPASSSPVRGGPAWIRAGSDKYAIEAVVEGDPDKRQLMGPMLRALLEERFQLRTHREREEAPMYALTVAKGGLKVQPMTAGDCTEEPPTRGMAPGAKPTCGSLHMTHRLGNRRLVFGGTTFTEFARTLSNGMDRYVLDRTGISGEYILHLEFAQDDSTPNAPLGVPLPPERAPDDPPGVSIFTALQEQLGLKLEPTRGPREVLVIDHVERPTPNSAR